MLRPQDVGYGIVEFVEALLLFILWPDFILILWPDFENDVLGAGSMDCEFGHSC